MELLVENYLDLTIDEVYDDLTSSEDSLSNLLGYYISLSSMDDRVLDKAITDLEQKGIELSYNDAFDPS